MIEIRKLTDGQGTGVLTRERRAVVHEQIDAAYEHAIKRAQDDAARNAQEVTRELSKISTRAGKIETAPKVGASINSDVRAVADGKPYAIEYARDGRRVGRGFVFATLADAKREGRAYWEDMSAAQVVTLVVRNLATGAVEWVSPVMTDARDLKQRAKIMAQLTSRNAANGTRAVIDDLRAELSDELEAVSLGEFDDGWVEWNGARLGVAAGSEADDVDADWDDVIERDASEWDTL